MNALQPRVALGLALAAFALAACDRPTVDRTVANTKEELARAGEQVKPALEKAGEKMKEAATGDPAITASIKASYLKDPDLSVFKIDVDTKDGVVTLNGIADNSSALERAVKLAEATKGVKEVRNHLTVKQG